MENLGGLTKVLVECTSMGASGNEPTPLAEEDKTFLNNALSEFVGRGQIRHPFLDHFDALKDIWTENADFTRAHFNAITELEVATEMSDQADAFINLGGMDVAYNLLASTKEELLISLCDVIANVSQNNELFASHPKCFPIFKYLLVKLKLQTALSMDVKSKFLYAANSITSANTDVIKKIVSDEHVGLKDIMAMLLKATDPKLAVRLTRLAGRYLKVHYDLPIVMEFTKKFLQAGIQELQENRRLYFESELEELEFIYTKINFIYIDVWCLGFELKDSGFSHINIMDDIHEFFRLLKEKYTPEICNDEEKEAWEKLLNLYENFKAKVRRVENGENDDDDEEEEEAEAEPDHDHPIRFSGPLMAITGPGPGPRAEESEPDAE